MLINPASLYSGGNVRFDNTPYLRMAMQQRARKQALDEASTQYFTKLAEKLNPAGARPQDMEDPNGNGGIQTDIDRWQEKWNLNKDAIKRGGIAQQEFMGEFNRIKQKIGESKNRVKTQAQMGKYAMGGQWRPRSADHPVIEAMDLSIYDPKSKKEDGVSEYGLNDLSLAAKPYTPDYQIKHDKFISAEIEPDRLPGDNGVFDPVTMKVTYKYGYTPEKVKQIVQNGLATLKSDKTMMYAMEDALQDDKQVEIASRFLQEDYDRTNKDGMKVVVDTPEEMYAGLQMAKFASASVPKTFTDRASINEWNAAENDRRFWRNNAERKKAAALRSRQSDDRVKMMMSGGGYEYPLDRVGTEAVTNHEILSADGVSYGTQPRVYKNDISVGELEIYNPGNKVRGYKDVKTGEEYYLPVKDANGHIQLVGEGDKIIGAEVARQNAVKLVVPANKEKRSMLLNKDGKTSNPTPRPVIKGTKQKLF